MTDVPETRYARSPDGVHIAFQVIGEGPFDLVYVPGALSHVEHYWEEPSVARFLERLSSFSRLILFDKRGTGLSDPVAADALPTLEQRMEDLRSVMDAASSERAAIIGPSDGGPMAAMFAATYPERTIALVLVGAFAFVPPERRAAVEAAYGDIEATWGDGSDVAVYAPSMAEDVAFRRWWGRQQRLGGSPGTAIVLRNMTLDTDIRPVLPTIRVPTLVLHRSGDQRVPVLAGRFIASQIPDAQYVELDGTDHLPFAGRSQDILDAVEGFLTGQQGTVTPDRVLATVLFTDIVDSTKMATDLGDRRWHDLLDAHDGLVRRQLSRFGGRLVKSTGDGILATFDGPAKAIRCACLMRDGLRPLGLEIRAGIHTGEVEVMGDDLGGVAVHIGARVMALAGPGEVLVSGAVPALVAGSGLEFEERGEHELKGVPGTWRLFAVEA